MILYLTRADIESLALSMADIIPVVEEGFRHKGLGETQMPPKTALYPRPGKSFLHAMPAYIGGLDIAAVKWIGGSNDNLARGLPTISALLILNDPETMRPLAIMDATWITMMRTGAANAVAMKYLGPRSAAEVAIIGCGVQGRSNLLAMQAQYPGIQRVRAYSRRPEAIAAYIAEMAPLTGLRIEAVASPEEAVIGADVIVTATTNPREPQPYIEDAWLKPGAMAAPVDYNGAWKPEALANVDRLVTDDLAQMDYYRSQGYFANTPVPDADLGEIVAGLKPGRQSDDERTMSICMGIAIDDAVTAKLICDKARERGVGLELTE